MAYYHDGALCLRAVNSITEKRLVSVNCPDGRYQPPIFQPDGSAISYQDTNIIAVDSPTPTQVGKCFTLADGTVRALPAEEKSYPRQVSYSPDKTKILFARADPPAIFIMNADKTGITQLTNARTDYERDSMPAFSPDGSSIVFKRSDDLFAMNTDTTQLRRLNPPGTQVIEYTFTPDGSQVLFSARPQAKLPQAHSNDTIK
jgi:dipeptidyl aminopeptidase/acylaminoacyl peptidase